MGDKVGHAFQLSTLCNGAYSVFQIEPTETFIRMLMLIFSALAGLGISCGIAFLLI